MANRVSHVAVEVLDQGAGRVRVSHEALEVLVHGIARARVSHVALEVLRPSFGVTSARVSHVATEVLRQRLTTDGQARVTQEAVEVLADRGPVAAILTQEAVEVLMPYLPRHGRFHVQIV